MMSGNLAWMVGLLAGYLNRSEDWKATPLMEPGTENYAAQFIVETVPQNVFRTARRFKVTVEEVTE